MSIDTYSETPKIKHLLEGNDFISTFYYSALLQDFK